MNFVAVKNEIELAHGFKALIERFDKDLYQIQNTEIRFLRINCKHKVECGVMPINEFNVLAVPFRDHVGIQQQVVAKGIGSGRHLLKDATNHLLLHGFGRKVIIIKLGQPRLPMIVDNNNALDHAANEAGPRRMDVVVSDFRVSQPKLRSESRSSQKSRGFRHEPSLERGLRRRLAPPSK
jgi:hypothetical protein